MNKLSNAFTAVILIFAAVASLVPFLAIAFASVRPPGSINSGFTWPSDPHWSNFLDAWTVGGFANLSRSSAIVALVVVPIGVLFATLGGYALTIAKFRGRTLLMGLFLLGLTLPNEAIVIPLYYQFRGVGLLDTYWALILPLAGVFMPFGIFWMRSHLESLPESVTEAAEMDGANSFTTFWRPLLPTAKPALAILALLYFMWTWNQFLLALILIQDATKRTAPAGLGQFVTQYGKDIPLLSASTLIVFTPVVIVYLIFQRQLVRGILQGAAK